MSQLALRSAGALADRGLGVSWLLLAVAVHAALLGAGGLHDESIEVVRAMRAAIRDTLGQEIEIEPAPPPAPPPEPEPEPKPEPEPEPTQAPPALQPAEDPYEGPQTEAPQPATPEPMEAPPVLVQEAATPDPSAVSFVTGAGTGHGMVAKDGTGRRPTYRKPRPGGGGGRPRPPPPPPPLDRSRPPSLQGAMQWDCGFPPEADAAGINNVVVTLQITVRPTGRAKAVKVLSDPGHGFGKQARRCAARHNYLPALDRTGQPILGELGPVRIRFIR